MNIEIISYSILLSAVVGISAALLGYLLDTLMDFGHVFWGVRHAMAKRAARKLGSKKFMDDLERIEKFRHDPGMNFEAAVEESAGIYWGLAFARQSFRIWVCTLCISLWAFVLLMVILFTLLIFIDFFYLVLLPFGVLEGAAICHFIISRL